MSIEKDELFNDFGECDDEGFEMAGVCSNCGSYVPTMYIENDHRMCRKCLDWE